MKAILLYILLFFLCQIHVARESEKLTGKSKNYKITVMGKGGTFILA